MAARRVSRTASGTPVAPSPEIAPAELGQVVQRGLVAAAVALPGIFFLKNTADPVNVPKLAVLAACTVLAIGVLAAGAITSRTVRLPWGPAAGAAVALIAAFSVSAAVAPSHAAAVLGAYGRNSGLLAYVCALVLFLVTLAAFQAAATKVIAFALLSAGLFTATYGFFQRLGHDSINWTNPFNPIIATLGNPDFASAYLGVTVPVAAWAACWNRWPWFFRALAGAVGVFCFGVAAASSAVQGPVAAAAGLGVLVLALALDLPQPRRRLAVAGVGGGAAVAVLVGALGPFGVGPARSFFSGIPWDSRTWYWQAAMTMWRRSPVTGIGLDSYGMYWPRDRPLDSPRTLGGAAYSDSAHSVPIQHLTQGGLLLALAYAVFLVVVSAYLVLGMRRLAGQERLLLAGLGGAWVAYQVQSLVSIDHVALLVLNYVLGASVVVASCAHTVRVFRLPGALRPAERGRGRKQPVRTRRRLTPLDAGLLTAVGIVVLVGLWLLLIPVRANHAAFRATVASLQGDNVGAVAAQLHAVDLEPSVGVYRTSLGEQYRTNGQRREAREAFAQSFAVDGTQINAARVAAQLAVEDGDYPAADRLLTRALELDPSNSATIVDWATFQLAHGNRNAARDRLERGVRDLPGEAVLWVKLGEARKAGGDLAGARAAYERALVVHPGDAGAVEGLKSLDAGGG